LRVQSLSKPLAIKPAGVQQGRSSTETNSSGRENAKPAKAITIRKLQLFSYKGA